MRSGLEHLGGAPARRILVIGSGGFIGGAILSELRRQGLPAKGASRGDVDLSAPDGESKLAALVEAGDAIVMVAARAPARTTAQLMDNLAMAQTVIAAVASIELAHFLYVSSDAVYADDANPVSERSALAPSTLHGMMHAARELMFASAVKAPIAVLRPTLIYGPRDPHSGYGPNRFWREAAQSGEIRIFGEGEERRDHIFIDDVARLAVEMVKSRSIGSLNAATGRAASFHDIAHMLAAIAEPKAKVASIPRPGPRPHLLHRHFDPTARLKAFPNFAPTPLEEGLRRYAV